MCGVQLCLPPFIDSHDLKPNTTFLSFYLAGQRERIIQCIESFLERTRMPPKCISIYNNYFCHEIIVKLKITISIFFVERFLCGQTIPFDCQLINEKSNRSTKYSGILPLGHFQIREQTSVPSEKIFIKPLYLLFLLKGHLHSGVTLFWFRESSLNGGSTVTQFGYHVELYISYYRKLMLHEINPNLGNLC